MHMARCTNRVHVLVDLRQPDLRESQVGMMNDLALDQAVFYQDSIEDF